MFASWVRGLGTLGVVSDPHGAEECVSVVKEEELVVSSHPAQRNSSRWGLVETPAEILHKLTHTPAGVLHKLTHTYMYIQVILPSERTLKSSIEECVFI